MAGTEPHAWGGRAKWTISHMSDWTCTRRRCAWRSPRADAAVRCGRSGFLRTAPRFCARWRQEGRYRQARVTRLPATGGPRLGAPGRDRGLGEPDRQAAATAQAGVVRSPVRDPIALLRNMVTAGCEALERQRGILDGRRHRQALSLPQAAGGWRSVQHSGIDVDEGEDRSDVITVAPAAIGAGTEIGRATP